MFRAGETACQLDEYILKGGGREAVSQSTTTRDVTTHCDLMVVGTTKVKAP